jgi:hypothetical protein
VLDELEQVRRAHQRANRELQTKGNTAAVRMLAFATGEFGRVWEERAPFLTGTLASATRELVLDDRGRVFIDPTVENPVFGGRPAVYGPAVHVRKPWVDTLMKTDGPRILVAAGKMLFGELDGIFPGN